ncbi:hypothetical protein [Streptomyces sp. NPDC058424]|uniref:hypothetical protein n=1 Tax=Streptomyces sp. NPDC058424 TaxID=3346491 RepID=UPI0036552339
MSRAIERRHLAAMALMATGMTLSLAGCTPPEYPAIAVYPTSGGGISAVLHPCGDDRIGRVRLVRLGDGPDGGPGLQSWSLNPPESTKGEVDISILRRPEGWTGSMTPATEISKGRDYAMEFVVGRADGTAKYRGVVAFSAADLARLKDGEVWTDLKPMTLEEFRKQADGRCD